MAHLLFLKPQAFVITQGSLVCSSEHLFHKAEADTEKMVLSSAPPTVYPFGLFVP